MDVQTLTRRVLGASAALVMVAGLAACGSRGRNDVVNPGEQNADQYLFERGSASLERKHWLEAREYFRKLVDTYPTSRFRQDAKIGVGDSYLGERRSDSDVLASGEFREFLRFYPLAQRADYAQYKLAQSQVRQVLAPQRDQTATRDALKEVETFIASYPQSLYLPEVFKLQRQMRDRLSESEFLVGRHYYRTRWYPGAVTRLEELMKTDPQFTKRDGVYYYLAATYLKQNKKAEAKALLERLVAEFRVSDYLKDAQQELSKLGDVPATAPTTVADSRLSPADTAK